MGVWDEASNGAEQREGFNLQMGRGRHYVGFVKRDVSIILLVYIQILDKALPKKVIKCNRAFFEKLKAE